VIPSPVVPNRTRRPALVTAGIVVMVALAAACSPASPETATTGCATAVADAARSIDIDDQKRFLDEALLQCRSVADLANELNRHPGLLGFSATEFVTARCARIDDPATLRAPTCAAVAAPATTAPPTTVVDVVFVGDTLDDRRIEIRPGATTRFVGEVPEVVQQTVDIAFESGCDGLIAQRDLWFGRTGDPVTGDEASVYARHAQNVAEYIGCEIPPLPT
jgi:hypothetical protein